MADSEEAEALAAVEPQADGKIFKQKGQIMKLTEFTENLKEIMGNRLKSVFVFGSKSGLGIEELNSDVNLMVIADLITGEDLKKCSKISQKWIKAKNPAPIFMGEEEWFSSADVYAMEYSDIKENHKIIFGDDLICAIEVQKEDLRLQCEYEAKNLLMRFRSHYLQNATSPFCGAKEIKKSITPVIKTCTALFKAILRIKDIEVPKSPYEVLNKTCEMVDINKGFFEKLLCNKDKSCDMKAKEAYDTADEIISELNKLYGYINNL